MNIHGGWSANRKLSDLKLPRQESREVLANGIIIVINSLEIGVIEIP